MRQTIQCVRFATAALAAFTVLAACDKPPAPHQATAAQIAEMEAESSGASSSAATAEVDWAALIRRIDEARAPADRLHWVSTYLFHAEALPQEERNRRLDELPSSVEGVR